MSDPMFAWIAERGHWAWLIGGVLLVVVEVLVPGAFFLWLGVSAGIVGIVAWIFQDLGWQYQFMLFALLSVASIAISRMYLRRHPIETDEPLLNRRSAQYVGRRFTLSEPIVNGRGRIVVDDSSWKVEGPDLPAGATIEVVSADGVVLAVEPADGEGAPESR